MIRNVALALVAVLTLAATPAAAQERGGSWGIGVGIVPELWTNPASGAVEIYVPIRAAPNLRIEPSLGIGTASDGDASARQLVLGVGVFAVNGAGAANVYYGGRLKLNLVAQDTGVTDDSGNDLSLAGALGGEYFVAPKFSLGAEAQLGYYSLSDLSGGDSGFFTNGIAFVRFYF